MEKTDKNPSCCFIERDYQELPSRVDLHKLQHCSGRDTLATSTHTHVKHNHIPYTMLLCNRWLKQQLQRVKATTMESNLFSLNACLPGYKPCDSSGLVTVFRRWKFSISGDSVPPDLNVYYSVPKIKSFKVSDPEVSLSSRSIWALHGLRAISQSQPTPSKQA